MVMTVTCRRCVGRRRREGSGEQIPLSEIIELLNERFGTSFGEEDRMFFEQIREKALRDEDVVATAKANPVDKFMMGVRRTIQEMVARRHAENGKIVGRYVEDEEFQGVVFEVLAREIWEGVRGS